MAQRVHEGNRPGDGRAVGQCSRELSDEAVAVHSPFGAVNTVVHVLIGNGTVCWGGAVVDRIVVGTIGGGSIVVGTVGGGAVGSSVVVGTVGSGSIAILVAGAAALSSAASSVSPPDASDSLASAGDRRTKSCAA